MNAFMNVTVRVATAAARARIKELEAELALLQKQAAGANATSAALGTGAALSGLTKYANRMQWVGRQIQTNFTTPLLIAGGFAVKFALDNEKAMTRVTKVYGDGSVAFNRLAKTEIPALEKAFESLSNEFGVNRAEVNNIAGDWAAAGASGVALAKAVKLTMQTMVLGEMDATAATRALIAIQAQYGLSTVQLSKVIDTLNMVENQTGTSMEDLVIAFQKAAGSARSAGVDYRHLAAMISSIVPAAGTASQAGNGLKTILTNLLAPTKKASENLARLKIDTDSLAWSNLNGSQRLTLIAKKYLELNKGVQSHTKVLDAAGKSTGKFISAQQEMISNAVAGKYQINRFDTLMRDLVNDNGYYKKSLESTADPIKNFQQKQKELNTVLDSSPQRLKQIWTIIQNGMADAIQPLIPMLLWLGTTIARVFTWFSNLNPAIQKMVIIGLALLAMVGPVTRYFFAWVVLVDLLKGAFGGLNTVASVTAKIVMAPFTALGTALGGIWGLFYKTITGMVALASGGFGRILAMQGAFSARFLALWNLSAIANLFSSFWSAIVGLFAAGESAVAGVTAAGIVARLSEEAAGVASSVAIEEAGAAQRLIVVDSTGAAIVAAESAGYLVRLTGLEQYFATSSAMYLAWKLYILGLIADLQSGILAIEAGASASRLALEQGASAGRLAIEAAGGAAEVATVVATQEAIVAATAAGGAGTIAAATTTRTGVLTVMSGLLRGVVGLMLRLGAMLLSPWVLATLAVLAVLYAFRDKIGKIFTDIKAWVSNNMSGVARFFQDMTGKIEDAFWSLPSAITGALIAVVKIIRAAALQVYEWFSYLNPWAHHSPSLVESVTSGMNEVARQMGRAKNLGNIFAVAAADLAKFKKMSSSLGVNPFTDDRAQVAKSYKQALPLFDKLVKDWKQLNVILDAQKAKVDAQQKVVDKWKAKLDAANLALDKQNHILDGLQNNLDKLNNEYQSHQDAVDKFASAPLVGMKAMEDQIFANDQAQKALRLEMMKWEDVNGSIDDVRANYEALQGDIESLRGEQASLRAAGAGSDITGPMQQQIDAMKAQATGLANTINNGPMAQWQKQLDALQRQADELDLEKSLNFDGLNKQIQDLVNTTQELTFDQIVSGITSEQSAMAALQPQIDSYTAQVKAQQAIVDALTASRDALQLTYDAEDAKLQKLQDAYQKTADTIRDIESALRDMASAAQSASAASKAATGGKKGKGAGGGAGGAGAFPDVGGTAGISREGGLGDQSKLIDEFTKQQVSELGKTFGSLDMLGPLKKKWNQVWGWLKDNVGPAVKPVAGAIGAAFGAIDLKGAIDSPAMKTIVKIFQGIGSVMKDVFSGIAKAIKIFEPDLKRLWDTFIDAGTKIWHEIGPELVKFGPIFKNLGSAIKGVWAIVKPFAMILGGELLIALKLVASIISTVLWPVLSGMIDILKGVIVAFRGVAEFIVGVFSGDVNQALQGLWDMFSGTFTAIKGIVETIGGLIGGIVLGLVHGIVESFTWLKDILTPLVTGIVGGVRSLFESLGSLGQWVWDHVLKPTYDFFVKVWNNYIKPFVGTWWDGIKNILSGLATLGQWIFDHVLKPVINIFTSAFDTVKSIVGSAKDKIVSTFQSIIDKVGSVVTAVKNLPDKITDLASNMLDAGKSLIHSFIKGMMDAAGIALNIATAIVNAIIDFINDKIISNLNNALEFDIKVHGIGITINPPDIPKISRLATGGIVPGSRLGQLVIVGDGGHDEAVVPLSGPHAPKALPGGMNDSSSGGGRVINIYGDLSFPNISDPSDVEAFLKNLEILAG